MNSLAGGSTLSDPGFVSLTLCHDQVQRIVTSKTFQSAPTLQQLFRFLATRALQAHADEIKEYTIGVEALGRKPDFDPKTDPIVRVQVYRSGPPLLMTASAGGLLPQNSGQRVNYVCTGQNNPRTISQWFDTSCFAQPQGFVLGNGGVGDVYGPRYQDWDITASKGIFFGESEQLRFQASFFT
jgi:hypothetical protein